MPRDILFWLEPFQTDAGRWKDFDCLQKYLMPSKYLRYCPWRGNNTCICKHSRLIKRCKTNEWKGEASGEGEKRTFRTELVEKKGELSWICFAWKSLESWDQNQVFMMSEPECFASTVLSPACLLCLCMFIRTIRFVRPGWTQSLCPLKTPRGTLEKYNIFCVST